MVLMAKMAETAKLVEMTKIVKTVKIVKMDKMAKIAQMVKLAKIAVFDKIGKIAEIAETDKVVAKMEIVILLKTFTFWVFFEKIDGFFFEKKTWTFFKIVKVGKVAVECVSNGFLSWKVFRPSYEVFWEEIRKHWTLENLETMIKKECFFWRKKMQYLLL